MIRILLVALLLSASSLSVRADDFSYEPQDAEALQSCFEAVNDSAGDPEATEAPSLTECIGVASTACQSSEADGGTTVGMVMCNTREQAWWDEYLNWAYSSLGDSLSTELFSDLKTVQRSWIAFRDGKCSFVQKYWQDGTINQIMSSDCLMRTTAERAVDLADILDWGTNQ